ncbi:MAG TPA: GDSL-type esterase/lipase family protein [Terriglobales bacterium]|jgi:peptidoglycan/xylan/chitin deacetylase (PgdA/CDA1 family)|nr:GDSL-type esterase/lipase family protein [Terriglobales bacterium]
MNAKSNVRAPFSTKGFPSIFRIGRMLLFPALLGFATATYCGESSVVEAHWVGSWAASQQLVEPGNALSVDELHDATLRQIVHLSIGGREIRLRLSNRFGTTPLHLTAAHVARSVSPSSDKIVPGTDEPVTFSGSPDVTIPPHADYISDTVSFTVNGLSDLAVTLHIDTSPEEQTGHPGSRAISYLKPGDSVSALELPGAKTFQPWYFLAGIDVAAPSQAQAIVILGDSITDGHGSTTNGNNRWTDILAQRLQSQPNTRNLAVLNQGIGGNFLLSDGLGPGALVRFDHDVIAQSGVRDLIVLEGINDIGTLARRGNVLREEHDALVHQVIGAYQQMIARAHAHHIKIIGATIMPFAGSNYYHPGPASEADRHAINDWIRTPGHFDAVIDFDQITRDPMHPERLLPAFDSGDHLHPAPAGYAAMAESVPSSLFVPSADPAPKIAITFDDLPTHGPLLPGETRMEVISKIVAALRDANLPATYGFVNGVRIEEQSVDAGVLQIWHTAGNPLANHTWSHMNLNQHSLEEFEQDVVRDEPVLASFMNHEDWRWFRYPFLAEGDTPEKRTRIRDFLREHGYKIAAVTMSFDDYLWNEPYTRCKAKSDTAPIEILENSYLSAASESVDYYRGIAYILYQRDIPYVLLMHVGAFDAEMLPRLLQLYRDKGFEFITLPEAERDEFYRDATDLDLPPGPGTLEEAMSARHLSLPLRMDFAVQLDSLCR